MRRASRLAALAVAVCLVATAAHAASSPFGIATPDTSGGGSYFGGPLGPVFAWVAVHQAAFYRSLTAALSGLKQGSAGLWLFFGLSFAYGVFHAVGPGHGKAVIASYLVANRETARRGIVLSFASALMQSLVAILIVGISAWVLNATAKTMCKAEGVIEIASYGLIALFGLRLVWTKGRTFIRALQAAQPVPAIAGVPHHHDHGHHHHHDAHDHHDHAHGHDRHDHAQVAHLASQIGR